MQLISKIPRKSFGNNLSTKSNRWIWKIKKGQLGGIKWNLEGIWWRSNMVKQIFDHDVLDEGANDSYPIEVDEFFSGLVMVYISFSMVVSCCPSPSPPSLWSPRLSIWVIWVLSEFWRFISLISCPSSASFIDSFVTNIQFVKYLSEDLHSFFILEVGWTWIPMVLLAIFIWVFLSPLLLFWCLSSSTLSLLLKLGWYHTSLGS